MKKLFLLVFISICTAFSFPEDDVEHYTKSDLLGDINPESHRDFDHVKSKYTRRSDSYLRDEVYDAFKKMWKDAHKDGVDLIIISATRNRAYQTRIWNRKWDNFKGSDLDKVEQILEYSSMPGTSRHHWGTDFDLNALENSYFESGRGLKIYTWLQQNAHRYGFFQPYTAYSNYRDAGYREEKWHWSYYPLASKFQRAYSHIIHAHDIIGFSGSQYVDSLDVINNYVNGIEIPPNF